MTGTPQNSEKRKNSLYVAGTHNYTNMYSPKAIFEFMTSQEFHSIMNQSFYKRHMESDDNKSPFDNPESIIFLEWLIDHNYIIAEYR